MTQIMKVRIVCRPLLHFLLVISLLQIEPAITYADDSLNFEVKLKEWAIAAMPYASVLSGPVLACACATFLCLIPVANVMEEPEYWYEYQIMEFFAIIPLLVAVIWGVAIYWCKFTVKKKWFSFTWTLMIGCGSYGISVMTYYLLWTYVFELNLPFPFLLYTAGTTSIYAIVIAISIRYWL